MVKRLKVKRLFVQRALWLGFEVLWHASSLPVLVCRVADGSLAGRRYRAVDPLTWSDAIAVSMSLLRTATLVL